LENGADLLAIKELLGHSSLQATQVYTHNTIQKLKETHRKAHPRSEA
ncbi:MAG: tyrosine-type recombinase/integrase, partial [Bacteroidota bacterium]